MILIIFQNLASGRLCSPERLHKHLTDGDFPLSFLIETNQAKGFDGFVRGLL